MEQINKVELNGNVGNVRFNQVGDNLMVRFSLATNYMYKGKDGSANIETTWHNVVAWEGKGAPDLSSITKGMALHVTGRLRMSKYKSSDGTEKQSYEIVANKVSILEEQPNIQG